MPIAVAKKRADTPLVSIEYSCGPSSVYEASRALAPNGRTCLRRWRAGRGVTRGEEEEAACRGRGRGRGGGGVGTGGGAPVEGVDVHETGDAVAQHVARDDPPVEVLVRVGLLAGVGHHLPRVGHQPGHAHARVLVYGEDPPVRALDQHLRQLGLLHPHHHAVLAPDADSGATVVHGLGRVLDLEDAAIGRVGRRRLVVARTNGRHPISHTRARLGEAASV